MDLPLGRTYQVPCPFDDATEGVRRSQRRGAMRRSHPAAHASNLFWGGDSRRCAICNLSGVRHILHADTSLSLLEDEFHQHAQSTSVEFIFKQFRF